MRTIIGQFASSKQARTAVQALLEHNYDRVDISYVAGDTASDTALGEHSDPAAAGGAALGLLAGLVSLTIPYVGPLLAAGPIAAGLAGAAVGVGQQDQHWLTGVLGEAGVSDVTVRGYGDAIQRGGGLVLMGAREVVADNITAILRDCGAERVDSFVRDPSLPSA